MSGWKEEIIMIFLLLVMFLYLFYRRLVVAVTSAIFSIPLVALFAGELQPVKAPMCYSTLF